MIARHDADYDRTDVWRKLAEPVDEAAIAWRQDGKAVQRDGRHYARFVCYIEANTVRERLDTVVPGEWDLTLDLLPTMGSADDAEAAVTFKARLQILGVIREDVGTGRDYKSAATDAFKRVSVRFGIGHELYAYEQNWVEVDGDGRYAKPLEDPGTAYARKMGRKDARDARAEQPAEQPAKPARSGGRRAAAATERVVETSATAVEPEADVAAGGSLRSEETPPCPSCGGRMWDNRLTKRNPKAPDYKCRDRNCEGVIWPPRGGARPTGGESEPAHHSGPLVPVIEDDVPF